MSASKQCEGVILSERYVKCKIQTAMWRFLLKSPMWNFPEHRSGRAASSHAHSWQISFPLKNRLHIYTLNTKSEPRRVRAVSLCLPGGFKCQRFAARRFIPADRQTRDRTKQGCNMGRQNNNLTQWTVLCKSSLIVSSGAGWYSAIIQKWRGCALLLLLLRLCRALPGRSQVLSNRGPADEGGRQLLADGRVEGAGGAWLRWKKKNRENAHTHTHAHATPCFARTALELENTCHRDDLFPFIAPR